jgi:hypothetical protein
MTSKEQDEQEIKDYWPGDGSADYPFTGTLGFRTECGRDDPLRRTLSDYDYRGNQSADGANLSDDDDCYYDADYDRDHDHGYDDEQQYHIFEFHYYLP